MDIEHNPPTIHPKARKFIYNFFFKNKKTKRRKKGERRRRAAKHNEQ
jgi:hypothetical protein